MNFLSELTDTLLAAQAFVFFAAGFETSSTAISNALYELALHEEVQKKLREEIKEFDQKTDGKWRYETIKKMTYLDKVFKGWNMRRIKYFPSFLVFFFITFFFF